LGIGGRDDEVVPWDCGRRKRDPINPIIFGRVATLVEAVRGRAFDGGRRSENRVIRYSLVERSRLESDLLPQSWTFVIRKPLEETLPDPVQDTLFALYGPYCGDGVLLPVTRNGIVTIDEARGIQSQV